MKLSVVLVAQLFLMCSAAGTSILDHLAANLSMQWNEDLEPVVDAMTGRLQRLLLPFAQDVIYDDVVSLDCIQAIVRVFAGLRDRKLWAFKCM